MKRVKRRNFLELGGSGLLSLFLGNAWSSSSPEVKESMDDISYKVIAAYRDDLGRQMQLRVPKAALKDSLTNNQTFKFECGSIEDAIYLVTDYGSGGFVSPDDPEDKIKKQLIVARGCISKDAKPKDVTGFFVGRQAGCSNSYAHIVEKAFMDYVKKGGEFLDLRGLEPLVTLPSNSYRGVSDFNGWNVKKRTAKGTVYPGFIQEYKATAGIDLNKHCTMVEPPGEGGGFTIYEQKTGRLLNPKRRGLNKKDMARTFLKDLPKMMKHFNVSGPVYVAKEFYDNAELNPRRNKVFGKSKNYTYVLFKR